MINKSDFTITDIDDITPYENNSRFHSEKQIYQIANSIKQFGFNNPIQADENGIILSGHGRMLAAKHLGLKEVPVVTISNLSESEKKAYIIADNKLALNSSWNDELLQQEIQSLKDSEIDLDILGWDVLPEFISNIDYSVLDDDDLNDELSTMTKDVKKAIQIEFESDDYEEAQQVVKFWRDKNAYVGGIVLDFLRREMNKV